MSVAAAYRAAQRAAGGACPIEAGVIGRLADHECRHGRLAGDRTPPCGCWPSEAPPVERMSPRWSPTSPVPDLMSTLKAQEEAVANTATPRRARKKPAKRTPKPATPVASESSALIARIVGELDTEIARLTRAREALRQLDKAA